MVLTSKTPGQLGSQFCPDRKDIFHYIILSFSGDKYLKLTRFDPYLISIKCMCFICAKIFRYMHYRKWLVEILCILLVRGRFPPSSLRGWDSVQLFLSSESNPSSSHKFFLNKEADKRKAGCKAPLPKWPSVFSLFLLICYSSTTLKKLLSPLQPCLCSPSFPTLQLKSDKPHLFISLCP